MPLIPLPEPIVSQQEPNFASIINEVGLNRADNMDLEELLVHTGLGKVDVINSLADIMRTGETSSTRLKAVETALKLLGLMKSTEAVPQTQVTIIIKDPEYRDTNPILMPRG